MYSRDRNRCLIISRGRSAKLCLRLELDEVLVAQKGPLGGTLLGVGLLEGAA
jgi:hypothetical protein